jgi:hypothetical protein
LTNHKSYAILLLLAETHDVRFCIRRAAQVPPRGRTPSVGVDQLVADDDLRVSLPGAKTYLNN